VSVRLPAQHTQRISERWNPVPAQFHVVRQALLHDMHVRVVEARYDRAALQVDHHGRVGPVCCQPFEVASREHSSVSDSQRRDERLRTVESRDPAAMDDHLYITGLRKDHSSSSAGHAEE
jgi:predicted subunit of tRNA(5-methylaminomethyl-2-thiouridylate) methyltransferase